MQISEFAKRNIFFLVAAIGGGLLVAPPILAGGDTRLIVAGWLAASLFLIKAIDLLLSLKRGLAFVVILFAIADATLAFLANGLQLSRLKSFCAQSWTVDPLSGAPFQRALCPLVDLAPLACGLAFAALVLMLLAPQLSRGLKDSGFVAPTFLAERRRRSGI